MNNSEDIPTRRPKRFLYLGAGATVIYLGALGMYAFAMRANFLAMHPNEFGDFLAGAFSPLAFFWLVLGYIQQGEELKNSADALWLQGHELQNSVEQQRELVQVTREQLAHERQATKDAELRAISELEAAEARSKRAKVEEQNNLIDQILTLGLIAKNAARKSVERQTEQLSSNTGSISGNLETKHFAQLLSFLSQAKLKTADVSLLVGIDDLEVELEMHPIHAEGGAAYIAELNKRLHRIDRSLEFIGRLRQE
ncbi:MAG: hypothetical protein SFV20_10510 [Sphingopyxis sp.]|nr:hypothetical protein [Sphingopyxis sp.]